MPKRAGTVIDDKEPRGNANEPHVLGDDRLLYKLSIPAVRRQPSTTLDSIVRDVYAAIRVTLSDIAPYENNATRLRWPLKI